MLLFEGSFSLEGEEGEEEEEDDTWLPRGEIFRSGVGGVSTRARGSSWSFSLSLSSPLSFSVVSSVCLCCRFPPPPPTSFPPTPFPPTQHHRSGVRGLPDCVPSAGPWPGLGLSRIVTRLPGDGVAIGAVPPPPSPRTRNSSRLLNFTRRVDLLTPFPSGDCRFRSNATQIPSNFHNNSVRWAGTCREPSASLPPCLLSMEGEKKMVPDWCISERSEDPIRRTGP